MKTQMMRSTTNKVVAGVAGGVAEAFGWDVTLVRLGFVVLTLAHGGGLLLYLVLMLVMPKSTQPSVMQQAAAGLGEGGYQLPTTDRNRTLGYVLLAVGAIMLAGMLHITGPVIAVAIIGAGYYLLRKR
jgi:phage shock protein C